MKKDHDFAPWTGERCYHKHPPLPVQITHQWTVVDGHEKEESKQYLLYGGSCLNPAVKDADIYIGFDASMDTPANYPWRKTTAGGPVLVKYAFSDGGVPSDPNDVKAMIHWIAVQLIAGKKVHMGCIGGHGRTGTIMAALVKELMGVEDAISYVRKHYCEKVVESKQQVDWLHYHFGITKQTPSYELRRAVVASIPATYRQPTGSGSLFNDLATPTSKATSSGHRQFGGNTKALRMSSLPTTSPMSLWGTVIRFDK